MDYPLKPTKLRRMAYQMPAPPRSSSAMTRRRLENQEEYQLWLKTNVFQQKQTEFYAVNIKIGTRKY